MNEVSDWTLVQRCLTGETEAFGLLIDRYQKVLFNLALRMTGNPEDARDLTQTAFMKAYEKLGTFRPDCSFFSWLFRIGINESLNFLKRRRPVTGLEEHLPSAEKSAEEIFQSREVAAKVQTVLMGLAPKYRILIVLRHFQNLGYEEIASVTGVSVDKVKSRLFMARGLLKDELMKMGFTHD